MWVAYFDECHLRICGALSGVYIREVTAVSTNPRLRETELLIYMKKTDISGE